MKTVAGIDLGTQSMKVVLYDCEAKRIAESSTCALQLICKDDGTREQKAEWFKGALKACFASLSVEAKSTIQAVGVSAQQHGFVALDEAGEPLYNVKLWNDTSTSPECEAITQALGGKKEAARLVQNHILPGFTAPKVLWLKNHERDLFSRLHYIMLPHDYLNYLLTGRYTAEPGDASGTALFDSTTRTWSKTVCDTIDSALYGKLAPLIKSCDPAGVVSHEAAAWLGIPEGAIVSSGGGDNMMSAIGTGVLKDGMVAMSMGTSGTLCGASATPVSDPDRGISGFCSSTGGYLPLLCTMNCTVSSEQLRSLLGMSVEEFDEEAAKTPAGSEGVYVLPFFNGERTPNLPHGRASITGLTAANCSKANIARAAFEGAVFSMRGGLEVFKDCGFCPRQLRLTGGGSKSALWKQIVADVMELPVKVCTSSEAAALGAALQSLWCLKHTQGDDTSIEAIAEEHVAIDEAKSAFPIAQNTRVYRAAFGEYQKLVETLSPLYS